MLKIVQHYGRHCSCHLPGECVMAGRVWKPYMEQEVGLAHVRNPKIH